MAVGEFDESARVLDQGLSLAPDLTELKFWAAVGMFTAGRESEALSLCREVFAKEPIWAELVPRLVPCGLLPDDPPALERILEQRQTTDDGRQKTVGS